MTQFTLFVLAQQRHEHTDAAPRQCGDVVLQPVTATGTWGDGKGALT